MRKYLVTANCKDHGRVADPIRLTWSAVVEADRPDAALSAFFKLKPDPEWPTFDWVKVEETTGNP